MFGEMILKDKIIIVTGGSGLIGKELVVDINRNGGKSINADIGVKTNLNEGTLFMDITDDQSVENGINYIVNKFGRIDGLVNNAYPRTQDWGTPFEDIKSESWRRNVDMQMNSYFVILQTVLKQMKVQRNGSIVNIASIYGVVGPDFGVYEGIDMTMPAAYSAIKGGVVNFSRYLASNYGQYGVRINCVSPGGVFNNQSEIFVKQYEKKVPLRRMALPSDIAPSVSFLLSDYASYITGHNLMVDGGWTAI